MSGGSVVRLVVSAVVVVGFAVGGYLLGKADAPTAVEAQEARAAARVVAYRQANQAAFSKARAAGELKGRRFGRLKGVREGRDAGDRSGSTYADEQIALAQEEEAELEYDPQLPNGDPGYLLPEDERSIACIGYSAVDGECVGD
jgi:hypothetical protein